MQSQLTHSALMVSKFAGMLIAVAAVSTMAASATSAPQPVTASAAQATVHEGVDWSRVAAVPADTGASIAAYDR